MIKAIASLLLAPFMKLGEKYLENQNDRDKLKAGTDRIVYQTDATVRSVKLTHWMGRLPLFVAEMSVAIYLAAILIDSTFPMEWLTPLELPNWFKPHFHIATASVFGIAAADRWLRGR